MTSSDDDRIQLAVAGDRDALRALLEEYGPQVRRGIWVPERWRSVLSIEDVMQEAFTDAFLHIRSFAPRIGSSFSSWLSTLARNNLRDALRMLGADKRGGGRHRVEPLADPDRGQPFEELASLSGSTPSRRAARAEGSEAIRRAIGRLPEAHGQVVRMYDLELRSIEEVASALGRSPGAAFMLRARAHRHLRQLLGTPSQYLS